jgi:hypothetical protein
VQILAVASVAVGLVAFMNCWLISCGALKEGHRERTARFSACLMFLQVCVRVCVYVCMPLRHVSRVAMSISPRALPVW